MLPSTNKTQNCYKHPRWRSKISVLVSSLSYSLAVIQPFDLYTSILILASIPVCGQMLFILRRYSGFSDKKAFMGEAVWDLSTVLCWESIWSPQPNWKILIFLSICMTITLIIIIVSSYGSLYFVSGNQ